MEEVHNILLDSRADASIFPASLLGCGKPAASSIGRLVDAQGVEIPAEATRDMEIALQDMNGRLILLRDTVAVSDRVSQPILSFGKMLENGWEIDGNQQMLVHTSAGLRQPPKVEGKQADKKTDVTITPPQSPQISTPPKKNTQATDQVRSSQKECLKNPPLARVGEDKKTSEPATAPPQASDPILTPTPFQLDNDPNNTTLRNAVDDDLINFTPNDELRRCGSHINELVKVNVPTQGQVQAQQRGVVIEPAQGVQDKPSHQNKTRTPTKASKGNSKGSPIQNALQRATTLSASDKTRICIDITGDENPLNDDDSIIVPSGHDVQTQLSQPQYRSLAPFLQVCRKWFHSFDSNIVDALAAKAQDIAINYSHIAGMNSALYLLSQGPWVPTHVSVHVRQAALAAVGLGWSWSKQIPTAFPFTCYEDCLAAATLDRIPPNSSIPVDAIYDFYTIICANLCQPTRNFFVLQS